MTEPGTLDLCSRIARLEKKRWAAPIIACGLGILGAALLAGAARPISAAPGVLDEVRAKKFVLVDSEGSEWGSMSVGAAGAEFLLKAPGTSNHFTVSVNKKGAALGAAIGLACGPDSGKTGVAIMASQEASSIMGCWKGGFPLVLGVDKNGPKIAMVGTDSEPRVLLGVSENEPALVLLDGKDTRAVLGHTTLRKGRPDGDVESRPASSLVLFGADGTVLERLPR
jgi:hypothetical protein